MDFMHTHSLRKKPLISQNQVWYWRNNLHPRKTESQSSWSSLAVLLSSGNQIHTTQNAHTICPSISFWMICEMPYSSIRSRTLIYVVYHYYQAAIYLFMAFVNARCLTNLQCASFWGSVCNGLRGKRRNAMGKGQKAPEALQAFLDIFFTCSRIPCKCSNLETSLNPRWLTLVNMCSAQNK